jgi:glycosyltransferase involved in cell wall biosynthesis
MKVAIVHDWLTAYAGAERVLSEILQIFPGADLFTVVDFMEGEQRTNLHGRTPRTTFIQRMPFARRRYRAYLPLMMVAIEQFDMSGYDLVISSSHAVAKGVLTGPDQLHISYVHSPIRYAWDLQHVYLREAGLGRGLRGLYARALLHYVRLWDHRTAHGVDHFIANSCFVASRIWKTYRREAQVIYPPVDTDRFTLNEGQRGDFYIVASRLVPYKRIPMIVQAFAAMPDKRLLVIGDGPEMPAVRRAAGPNVEILGYQSDGEMERLLRTAKAMVFAAEEDFGIVPVEAQACGTPVIAYGRGGVLESVVGLDGDWPTGVFFPEQTSASLVEAIRTFEREAHRFDPRHIRRNALRFSSESFRARFRAAVEAQLEVQRRRVATLVHDARSLIGSDAA